MYENDSSFPLLLQKLETLKNGRPFSCHGKVSEFFTDWKSHQILQEIVEKSGNFILKSFLFSSGLMLDMAKSHTLVMVIVWKNLKKLEKVREIVPHGSVIILKDNAKCPSVLCKKKNELSLFSVQ